MSLKLETFTPQTVIFLSIYPKFVKKQPTNTCRVQEFEKSHVDLKQEGSLPCKVRFWKQGRASLRNGLLSVYRGTSLIRKRLPRVPYSNICIGSNGAPRGGAVSFERGTPVWRQLSRPKVSFLDTKMSQPAKQVVTLSINLDFLRWCPTMAAAFKT